MIQRPFIAQKNKGVAEILLAHGAKVDAKDDKGHTPLFLVARSGFSKDDDQAIEDLAEVLIEHGADVNDGPPLAAAAFFNKLNMVKYLVANGANPKKPEILNAAVGNGDYVEMAKLLVGYGADVNARVNGEDPLHTAAFKGNAKCVDFLLSKGARVNALDGQGFTSLYLTASNDHGAPVAEILLDHGANPNARNPAGKTTLHQAAAYGATKIVKLLLAHKANPNAVDDYGNTPLIENIRYGLDASVLDIVELLVENGADLNTTSSETPLSIAMRKRSAIVAKYLREHGAH